MKKLIFEPVFDSQVEKVWSFFSDIENYPKYIKYSKKAYLFGGFKQGSVWDEWTTILFIPIYVRHKIKKVVFHEEIIYHVELPGAELWQKMIFEDMKGKTKVRAEVTISFKNSVLEKILGHLSYKRNIDMIESSIANFKQKLTDENN